MMSPKMHQKQCDGIKTMAHIGQSAVISTQSSVYTPHVKIVFQNSWMTTSMIKNSILTVYLMSAFK